MSRYREWDLSCKVYVGNLGSSASKHEIESAFGKYGPLRNVWVARNPPGFAFVEYEDPRDAEDAVRGLDGTRCCGSRVRVEMSSGRARRGGGGGGGRRGRYSRFHLLSLKAAAVALSSPMRVTKVTGAKRPTCLHLTPSTIHPLATVRACFDPQQKLSPPPTTTTTTTSYYFYFYNSSPSSNPRQKNIIGNTVHGADGRRLSSYRLRHLPSGQLNSTQLYFFQNNLRDRWDIQTV
ncbi:unnamed protein product [Phaedon cochleariae]|uniref:RRM domain-containing protein n=1 Tax=Phaedon cochleariae TaxID=80249 RepID=A0A9N9X4I5_PHACE|nr:unnamed protein product [Phaedon cochleariae]